MLTPPVTFSLIQTQVLNTCVGCHSKYQTNRLNAPVSINFDTYEDALNNDFEANMDILSGRMPPGGGITDPNVRCLFDAWIKDGNPH